MSQRIFLTQLPIIYLAQAYRAHPIKAILNAYQYTKKLRDLGFIVFSPILHNHHYKRHFWGKQPDDQCDDFVQWDLALLQGLMKGRPRMAIDRNMLNIRNQWDGSNVEIYTPIYDIGVAIAFAEDCLTQGYCKDELFIEVPFWYVDQDKSKGCLLEFHCANKNHIKRLVLNDILNLKSNGDIVKAFHALPCL